MSHYFSWLIIHIGQVIDAQLLKFMFHYFFSILFIVIYGADSESTCSYTRWFRTVCLGLEYVRKGCAISFRALCLSSMQCMVHVCKPYFMQTHKWECESAIVCPVQYGSVLWWMICTDMVLDCTLRMHCWLTLELIVASRWTTSVDRGQNVHESLSLPFHRSVLTTVTRVWIIRTASMADSVAT